MNLYKINEANSFKFIKTPKELFINPKYKCLDSTARELYSILIDRLSLSIKNNWVNDKGEVYLIFTRENLMEIIGISDKTLTRAFKNLSEVGLVKEQTQGKNRPNLIFIGKVETDAEYEYCFNKNLCLFMGIEYKGEPPKPLESWNRKLYDSGIGDLTTHDSENVRRNYTNSNNTNTIHTLGGKNTIQASYHQGIGQNNFIDQTETQGNDNGISLETACQKNVVDRFEVCSSTSEFPFFDVDYYARKWSHGHFGIKEMKQEHMCSFEKYLRIKALEVFGEDYWQLNGLDKLDCFIKKELTLHGFLPSDKLATDL
jgi:hypothetical protein